MDKTFKNDEAVRRNSLREQQKVKQERNRSLFLNGAQAISIVALACAVYVLSDLHTVIPVVATIGADGEDSPLLAPGEMTPQWFWLLQQ